MDKRDQTIQLLNEQGLMPLYFHADAATSIELMKALYLGGVRLIEYTNRGREALENFRQLKKIAHAEFKDLHLGAGTIKDEAAATAFIDAGADFLVSPALAEDVYDVAYSNKVLWIPGCMTPTEILKAEGFGIGLVKLFPGNILGPSYVSAIKDLFSNMQFMPTGGVETNKENLQSWFDAGVSAVGMGSKLVTKTIMENREYDTLAEQSRTLLAIIKNCKK